MFNLTVYEIINRNKKSNLNIINKTTHNSQETKVFSKPKWKEGNVLFNNTLNTFYFKVI